VGGAHAAEFPTSPQPSPARGWTGGLSEPPAVVAAADLERELAILNAATEADSASGFFGPGSMVWRIDREAAVFLAAGRALLLQLAHPWVAAAIAEHSQSLRDPIGRFHRTFGVVFTMVFGTTEDALAAARSLYRRHAAISGVLTEGVGGFPAGSAYRANDVAALRWVFATLVDSAIVAFELVNSPLSLAERERYYVEMRRFAAFFGISQGSLPPNWTSFAEYFDEITGSDALAVSSAARVIAAELIAGAGTWLRSPSWYRAVTASLLPDRLRAEFGLRYGTAERRAVRRAFAVLRALYPRIPARLRYVAPYQEACARLAGQRPAISTKLLNRLWIGRDSMAG
jgi:uncharacterized protein (DUF2236 family)